MYAEKTNLGTCGLSEGSDQPAHSRCLIRIFTGRHLGYTGMHSFFMRTTKTMTRLCECGGWLESSSDVNVRQTVRFLMLRLVWGICKVFHADDRSPLTKMFFFFFFFKSVPADTQHQNDVVSTSMRREHVASTFDTTSFSRCVPTGVLCLFWYVLTYVRATFHILNVAKLEIISGK